MSGEKLYVGSSEWIQGVTYCVRLSFT